MEEEEAALVALEVLMIAHLATSHHQDIHRRRAMHLNATRCLTRTTLALLCRVYWLVYNIPATVDHLDKNDKTTGTIGLNDKKKASYDPMCSNGPGAKTYHVTVYALSSEVNLVKGSDNRTGLLKVIKDITLAETTLDFLYEPQSEGTR